MKKSTVIATFGIAAAVTAVLAQYNCNPSTRLTHTHEPTTLINGRNPAAQSVFDQFDMTAAMHAAARGDLALLQRQPKEDLIKVNSNNAGVLYFAAQSQSNTIAVFQHVRSALNNDQLFVSLLNRQVGSNGHTVAMEAVFNINVTLIDYLLQLRTQLKQKNLTIDFSSPTVFGWTPKTFAMREKYDFAGRIPAEGITPEQRTEFMAAQEALFQAQLTDPKQLAYHTRGMELIKAAGELDLAKIESLAAAGVEVNGRYGRLGATPLNSTVGPGMDADKLARAAQAQALLLRLGAEPNYAEGGIMRVPSGFREAVFGYAGLINEMLTRLGPAKQPQYLNVQGSINGFTKLIDASLRGNVDVIYALLNAKADKKIRGHNGMTAYDAALVYNRTHQANPLPAEVLQRLQ